MNILVISSCTSKKSVSDQDQLTLEDFWDKQRLVQRTLALRDRIPEKEVEARVMYTGRQHEYVVEGVDLMRAALGTRANVDLQIVSAGYGLVSESDLLLPYEATFNGMRKKELQRYVTEVLHLPERVEAAVRSKDLVFFLLGETYLEALDIASLPIRPGLVFVAGEAARKWFPRAHKNSLVCFSNDDVKVIGGGQVGLKGAILRRLAGVLSEIPLIDERVDTLTHLAIEPQSLRSTLRIPEQVRLTFPGAHRKKEAPTIVLPKIRAKNAHERPRFFVPDWDDLVNPQYSFETDTHPQGIFDPYNDGIYAHELFKGTDCYDGLLVSHAVIDESNPRKRDRFKNVHEFLRWPKEKPIMGDCGAFSYLNEEIPPYSTDEVLNYYEDHGFTIGVSVDHLIVGDYAKDEVERNRRFRLTLENAGSFLSKHKAGKYSFKPMGIAQGWDEPSYERAVSELLDMGYKYIALGGLAFAKSQVVANILARISPLFPEDLYVHVFGLAREELLAPYAQLGVSAFDSATFLRRAWMSNRDNYLDRKSNSWYTAIRIPPAVFSVNTIAGPKPRFHRELKRLLDQVRGNQTEAQRLVNWAKGLEQGALKAIRMYGQGSAAIGEVLGALRSYDELVRPNGEFEDLYLATLEDKPWKNCDCPVCKELGIEAVIFRQNDRNRRRGFHNTFVFRTMEAAKWQDLLSTRPDHI